MLSASRGQIDSLQRYGIVNSESWMVDGMMVDGGLVDHARS